AEPAGEWGELYDPNGRPAAAYDAEWPNRLRPWESGVNLDAVMFALCGSRYASVPNWDNNDIRLKLRLPHGATYVTLKDLKKDGRHLDVYMREKYAKLTPQEVEANEQKKPEERRDPTQDYRRLAFHVDLRSADPEPKKYWDVAANAAN